MRQQALPGTPRACSGTCRAGQSGTRLQPSPGVSSTELSSASMTGQPAAAVTASAENSPPRCLRRHPQIADGKLGLQLPSRRPAHLTQWPPPCRRCMSRSPADGPAAQGGWKPMSRSAAHAQCQALDRAHARCSTRSYADMSSQQHCIKAARAAAAAAPCPTLYIFSEALVCLLGATILACVPQPGSGGGLVTGEPQASAQGRSLAAHCLNLCLNSLAAPCQR